MNRLRELRNLDEVQAFAEAVRLLAHLDLPENEAEALLGDVLKHRETMGRALGRDPGLRVAAVDYLSNVDRRLVNPKIVEMSEFERTERSAATDSLTRLYNRRAFRESLDREVRRGRRYGLCLSLAMLDLDDFKQVNDLYGHLFGDVVLQRVARLVRRSIREADVACRYGGEEIAVILPETERLGAYAVAGRIRERIEVSFREEATSGRKVPMTLSGGIAAYPEDGLEPDSLVARADEALYLAKRGGKNRITLYHRERRRWVRYPARPETRVLMESGEVGAGRPAMALNLSRSGMLLETAEPVLPASSVVLVMGRKAGDTADGDWVVRGRVVRVEPRPSAALGFRIGVAFDQPVPEECLLVQAAAVRQPLRAARGTGR
ncbi:MAG: GGDEF domain-containing protein [Acidobacteriia bacterium]|nr:GGDEF domain-containing protein [Terriglobia bacterium]